jgi:large subunit ribosomal protein L21
MFAIIRTGGKQYRVQPGDHLKVEKLDAAIGSEVSIQDVLFIGGDQPQFGTPLLKGAKVQAVVTQQDKAKKILIFKKKRRKGYRRMRGHRQPFTEIFISAITTPNGQSVKANGEPRIINPEEISKKKAERAETRKASEGKEGAAEKKASARPAPKKAASKKAPKKKAGSKKGSAKKKTAKKTAKKKE